MLKQLYVMLAERIDKFDLFLDGFIEEAQDWMRALNRGSLAPDRYLKGVGYF